MRDAPTYDQGQLGALTQRQSMHRQVLGNVAKRAKRSRAMSVGMAPGANPPPVPANVAANLLRNVVFHDLCALLNSATIYAPYKRYVRKIRHKYFTK